MNQPLKSHFSIFSADIISTDNLSALSELVISESLDSITFEDLCHLKKHLSHFKATKIKDLTVEQTDYLNMASSL